MYSHILTMHVSHTQEERKERDRKRAEDAMRRATGRPDYEMPEKSDVLLGYEDEVKEKRAAATAEAESAGENSASRIMHSEQDIMNVLMQYCIERSGRVIDAGTGADLMKFFIEKSIERDAQMMRAVEREKPDEDPKNLPSADEAKKQMAEKGQAVVDLGAPIGKIVDDAPSADYAEKQGCVESKSIGSTPGIVVVHEPTNPKDRRVHHVIDGTNPDGTPSYATTSHI